MGICSRIREVGNKYGKMDLMIQKGYVQMKECPRNESFADGNVGAGVRLMVRGGSLPVRGSDRMTWKYDDDKCQCGLVESEKCYVNVLYMEKKEIDGEGL